VKIPNRPDLLYCQSPAHPTHRSARHAQRDDGDVLAVDVVRGRRIACVEADERAERPGAKEEGPEEEKHEEAVVARADALPNPCATTGQRGRCGKPRANVHGQWWS
jgi:hypothetical protein